ncbi:MAG: glycine cleavage system protein GcvH [Candidatus Bathyarchaeota archaeon]|jgi:glycine cleavage system H protein|nr:glycine cleavage system protein GcvH [Candidatus Bathyarchaeota archaeon]
MNVEDIFLPENVYYTKDHEWALITENGLVRIGISDYAQKELHEVVFVDVPRKGVLVKQLEPLGTAESVKAVSEFFSPISGEIIERNEELVLNPELVNQEPYGRGWIVLIKPSNLEEEIERLMKPTAYGKYLEKLLQRKSQI